MRWDGWGPLGQAGCDLLAQTLIACGHEEFTGRVRVSGSPGGTLHLRHGLVVAVESPGSPGPEALLLRSGRVTDEQWAELVREAGGSAWPVAGLIAHRYAGAVQLRVVCLQAMQDATFAVVAGVVTGCERAPEGEPAAPSPVGETPALLLQDAARRLLAVAELPYRVGPDRERPAPGTRAVPAVRLTALRRELLLHADGRRTARDLAFRTGRAVYAVTVEVARMLAEGLLECDEKPVPARLPGVRPGVRIAPRLRALPPAPARPELEARHEEAQAPAEPTDLPRRRPGASGINEALNPQRSKAS
ncbi:MarR family transcriptional regulator [Streptomyces sp. VRA16 Mangrove soil]|uniref:MarR family transcriptional regulator n=1 Tax=Streptomyces sp. VRA16 Mangrove soil TaxID=2817434 RepID=UPI001A9F632F|nr:MarR family transcriptional regulator [Streptomyces sp. VRA16 Mangrove soil]MBO1334648.1 MarR family transcriptional regulator [Streptomyces sp. VRA16 Mangrove soil]